ncbi:MULTISPECIES: TerB family tellurite resistance protein [Ramlibacter]|uniref:TerB family tellurite resistance protein n=1 Tax=Ramlibacter aquaticus TaxID=2780094 RepID=A0ABR9SJE8_9BURK|nr:MULTISPECIES: TerB family tellurite resistance protein [Ramlibacter]MBE7941882.1 TerB family tellurite resistance protein [Ramlibacter aquaticus]
MLDALSAFLNEVFAPAADRSEFADPVPLRLAAAVLLVEVMRASDGIAAAERVAAARGLRAQFDLPEEALAPLIAQAEQASSTAYDYFRFTHPLDQQLPHEHKVALVESMWRVAYADGQVDGRENAVIARVADLLHVSHPEYIAAKLRAKPPGAA